MKAYKIMWMNGKGHIQNPEDATIQQRMWMRQEICQEYCNGLNDATKGQRKNAAAIRKTDIGKWVVTEEEV